MAVVKLTTENFDQEVLQAGQTVLVDFYADWCGPCKMMVCKINIDEEMAVAQKYGVMSIPTFIAFKNGEVAGKQIGAVPKSKLQEMIR